MCLTSFSSKLLFIFLTILFTGCFTPQQRNELASVTIETRARIAVLPIENLSGTPAPLKNIREALIKRLEKQGIMVLGDEAQNLFMTRNRMRYTGGLSKELARTMKAETGVDAVLVTSLELYDDIYPPKLSISCRLLSVNDDPQILWMEGAGLSGDDKPGLLALGVIEDPVSLRDKALDILVSSLMNYMDRQGAVPFRSSAIKTYSPAILYRSPSLSLRNGPYTFIVVPFLNVSERSNAGDLVALLFVEQLKKSASFKVIQPGLVRQELLNLRVIMEGGLSLANADALFSAIDADYVITGKVFSYQDYLGVSGSPYVDFTTIVIEKKTRRVVWSSDSYRKGTDSVYVFDFGQVNNAHAMASSMVGTIVMLLVQR
jgi:TolB-like protein